MRSRNLWEAARHQLHAALCAQLPVSVVACIRDHAVVFARPTGLGLSAVLIEHGWELPCETCSAKCPLLSLPQVRETRGDWLLALASCPALRCAPLAKYVSWRPPLEHLTATKHRRATAAPRPATVTDLRAAVRTFGTPAVRKGSGQ